MSGGDTTDDLTGPREVPALVRLPDLGAVLGARVRTARSTRTTTVADTDDLRLLRAGLRLVHVDGPAARGEGERGGWRLVDAEAADDDALRRASGGSDEVPDALVALLPAYLRGARPRPVAALSTRRTEHALVREADRAVLLRLADDRVDVRDGDDVAARWREVRLLPEADHPHAAAAADAALRAAGAAPGGPEGPVHLRVLGGAARTADLPAAAADRRSSVAGLLVAALADGTRRLRRADLDARLGDDDGVHQVRVSCRRLRSVLRLVRPLLDDDGARRVETVRSALADHASALGALRDAQVQAARLDLVAGRDPVAPVDPAAVARLAGLLDAARDDDAAAAGGAGDPAAVAALLDGLLDLVATSPLRPEVRDVAARPVLRVLLARDLRRLRRRVAATAPHGPDEPWHDARVAAKALRYDAEAAADVLGRAGALAERARRVQELLGDHADAALGAQRWADHARASGDVEVALATGRLVEACRAEVREVRAAFPRAWRRLLREATWLPSGRQAELTHLIASTDVDESGPADSGAGGSDGHVGDDRHGARRGGRRGRRRRGRRRTRTRRPPPGRRSAPPRRPGPPAGRRRRRAAEPRVSRGPDVLAAGCVLWRPAGDDVELALVHRPRYDDWSLPKGKVDPGEHRAVTAVREVAEETGSVALLGRPLGVQRYEVAKGRKEVTYWAAEHVGGDFAPNDEVDALEWVPPAEVVDRLTHERDAEHVRRLLDQGPRSVPLVVVRHAHAGSRSGWDADDRLRPLSARGAAQVGRLNALLPGWRPERVVSADLVRCTMTVQQVAGAVGLPLELDGRLDEASDAGLAGAVEAVDALVDAGRPALLCSQGGVIPDLVAALAGRAGVEVPKEYPKASVTVLHVADGHVVEVEALGDGSPAA